MNPQQIKFLFILTEFKPSNTGVPTCAHRKAEFYKNAMPERWSWWLDNCQGSTELVISQNAFHTKVQLAYL